MRAAAFRRALVLLPAALLALTGCSTPTKRLFLRHLEVTIAPAPPGSEMAASVTGRGEEPFLASVDTNEQ